MNLLPLSVDTWGEEERRAIQGVVDSGRYTIGEQVKLFEQKFSSFFGAKFAVMTNSGSSANLLMIAGLINCSGANRLMPGDEVIVPAVSWSTSFFPLAQNGLKLRFVDIDIDTLNLDVTLIEKNISKSTKAILTVNLLGNPNDYSVILKIAKKHNLLVIEDNCESMGAKYSGQYTGTFGVAGTHSFFFSHHISTMEGGMVLTDNEELYHIMLSLREHGWTRPLPNHNKIFDKENLDEFLESFMFVLPGYNLRPLEFSGAVGLEQLKKFPKFLDERQKNALHFQKIFQNQNRVKIQKEIGKSSWFGFSFILLKDMAKSRKEITSKLKSIGIDTRPIVAGNFLRHPVAAKLDFTANLPLVAADRVHDYGFFVGNHHFNCSKALDLLAETILE